jgi:hypothetical protein
MKVLKAVGYANGGPCTFVGLYLRTVDFAACGGKGFAHYTPIPMEAMQFPDGDKAQQYCRNCRRVPNCSAITEVNYEICDLS